MKALFSLLTVGIFQSLAFANQPTELPKEVKQSFFTDSNDQKIEFYYQKPEGKGPFPVLFMLHGSQPKENSLGAKTLVNMNFLKNFANEGIFAISISMPGFGKSEGKRDFAGPDSQKAIAEVIDHFSKRIDVDKNRLGIYGISQGAILASMVHRYFPCLHLQILEAGSYDMPLRFSQLPKYLDGILQNITQQAGDSKQALEERSAVYTTECIHAKTLILHGELDDRKGLASAKNLHQKLLSEGKTSHLCVFPNTAHQLQQKRWSPVIQFVREHFFNLHGIGTRIECGPPAIQIVEKIKGSPADLSKQLRLGDAILRISPNNDDQEIEVLNYSLYDFLPLILGKKGSEVRLHVQHLDLSFEDIILKRG